jgi:hypothetical protein
MSVVITYAQGGMARKKLDPLPLRASPRRDGIRHIKMPRNVDNHDETASDLLIFTEN